MKDVRGGAFRQHAHYLDSAFNAQVLGRLVADVLDYYADERVVVLVGDGLLRGALTARGGLGLDRGPELGCSGCRNSHHQHGYR